jgi:predicted hydrocarbon binding protein
MAYNITQEEVEKIKNIEGEVRGVVFKTDEHFILKTGGEDGLKKVEEEMKRMGAPVSYSEVDRMGFYPISLRIFSLIAISRVFNYNQEEIREMGKKAPRVSFLIKFFTKYFLSSEKTLARVTEIWGKHYTQGRVEATELKEAEGLVVFRLYDSNFHPIFCHYLIGYFAGVVSMVVGEKVESRETKCYFDGSEFHEFYMTWQV